MSCDLNVSPKELSDLEQKFTRFFDVRECVGSRRLQVEWKPFVDTAETLRDKIHNAATQLFGEVVAFKIYMGGKPFYDSRKEEGFGPEYMQLAEKDMQIALLKVGLQLPPPRADEDQEDEGVKEHGETTDEEDGEDGEEEATKKRRMQ